MAKFKVGDIIKANKESNGYYCYTNQEPYQYQSYVKPTPRLHYYDLRKWFKKCKFECKGNVFYG